MRNGHVSSLLSSFAFAYSHLNYGFLFAVDHRFECHTNNIQGSRSSWGETERSGGGVPVPSLPFHRFYYDLLLFHGVRSLSIKDVCDQGESSLRAMSPFRMLNLENSKDENDD